MQLSSACESAPHPGAWMRGGVEKNVSQGDDVVKSIGALLLQ
jgi:hypothetical protein